MESVDAPLEVILKGVISKANQLKKPAKLSWEKLSNVIIRNGGGELDFDTFETEYNTNPNIQGIVVNYDQHGIELISDHSSEESGTVEDPEVQTDEVGKMAKRATRREIG